MPLTFTPNRGAGTLSIRAADVLTTGPLEINDQTDSYTLASSDNGNLVSINKATAVTVTLPNDLTEGFYCLVLQEGAGQITFAAASGATVHSAFDDVLTTAQYSMASAIVLSNTSGTNAAWRLAGDLTT